MPDHKDEDKLKNKWTILGRSEKGGTLANHTLPHHLAAYSFTAITNLKSDAAPVLIIF